MPIVSWVAVLAVPASALIAVAQPAIAKQPEAGAARSISPYLSVYRSKYGFELQYPNTLEAIAMGPDVNELRLRSEGVWSGTQEPLLDQIVLRHGAEEIVRIAVAHYPLVVDGEWLWRPCGQDGFMRIDSRTETRVAGYRAVHVVSVDETDENKKIQFVCVQGPRPLIFTYADERRNRAEAIIATVRFAK